MQEFIKKLIGRLEELKTEAIDKWDGGASHRAYSNVIEITNQLAEEHNNGWIPCSERLPKDEELSRKKDVLVQNIYGEIFTAKYTYNCTRTHKTFFKDYCAVPYVIAWQPLPAPYQPKEGDT